MIRPRLLRLEVENFRSINEKIVCRLDAPVVLIHGYNGSGKTSLLSALELALTGHVPALERVDPTYASQLLHFGAEKGSVLVSVQQTEGEPLEIKVNVGPKGPSVAAGLSPPLAKFFNERCFLAQSSLSQLLTIYEGSGSDLESPLSKFVNELLGLDRLDALEMGLARAGDLRNARKLVPTYLAIERERARLAAEVESRHARKEEVAVAHAGAQRNFVDLLQRLAAAEKIVVQGDTLASVDATFERDSLLQLADAERSVSAAKRGFARLQAARANTAKEALEASVANCEAELSRWRSVEGMQIGEIFQRATALALLSSGSVGPEVETELANDRGRWIADLQRLELQLSEDRKASGRKSAVEDEVAACEARLRDIGGQVSAVADDVGGLSRALASVLLYIDGPNCPVCQRDFDEISEQPLVNVVAGRIAELGDVAARLVQLNQDRATSERRMGELVRESLALAAVILSDEDRLRIQDQAAKLRALTLAAERLQPAARSGSALQQQVATARRSLEAVLSSDSEELALRDTINEIARSLGMLITWVEETLETGLARVESQLSERVARMRHRLELKLAAGEALEQRDKFARSLKLATDDLSTTQEALVKVEQAFRAAETTRSNVRSVIRAVGIARTDVVSRVFNERLNRVWRDLFVRLAPTETYVPKFSLPSGGETKGARPSLRTIRRSGHEGGAPGAMLSAGNLNTAALTLFLALHLSVDTKIPWLVLDDPVQSMDEVHIAQFAALLRTLSKEHNRQILVAIHERPLFDYLTLELSPAFEGDELITIDIGSSSTGRTRIITKRHAYKADVAIGATAA
jgi:exonuclease SbcC